MKEEFLSIVRKRMPKNFRLKWRSMSIEYPLSVVPLSLYPPTLELVQVATKRGIFGLFRGWKTVGEIHIDEDAIYLWAQHFNKYEDIFIKVVEPIKDHIAVKMGVSKASQRYKENLQYNRHALNYHGMLKSDKE
jgi:hypothetical protein